MTRSVSEWLLELGLDRYAEAFVENDVEFDVLSELSDDDLSQLGLSSTQIFEGSSRTNGWCSG